MRQSALLALEDGSVFSGESIGVSGESVGEVVFNTAMTGYQEILTDPSYRKQIVTLTYPHIGNTGTNDHDAESAAVVAEGLVIRDLPVRASSWRTQLSLPEYLRQQRVVAIAGIDTRRLTRLLRDKGAQRGCLIAGARPDADAAIALARTFPGLAGMDLAQDVSATRQYVWTEGSYQLSPAHGGQSTNTTSRQHHVVVYDYGVKRNILRMLVDRGCRVTVVPARTPAVDVESLHPDGILLSNGPGDPEPCDYAIAAISRLVGAGYPVFGICLGHQLLALASGARTMKMKFGHHGANHPVQDARTGRVMITSQNHGFAVDEASLPPVLRVTHRSLFDRTLQGIERTDKPAFGFQGHPEASPGPHDAAPLFDHFMELMLQYGRKAAES